MNDEAVALFRALVADDAAAALASVERCSGAGMSRTAVFEGVIVPALSALGEAWARGEVSEDVLACSGMAIDRVVAFAAPPDVALDTGVIAVIGTPEGDSHPALSVIVASALALAGHRVVDIGTEAPDVAFVRAAEESGAAAVVVCASTDAAAARVERVSRLLAKSRSGRPTVVAAGSAATVMAPVPDVVIAADAEAVVRSVSVATAHDARAAR